MCFVRKKEAKEKKRKRNTSKKSNNTNPNNKLRAVDGVIHRVTIMKPHPTLQTHPHHPPPYPASAFDASVHCEISSSYSSSASPIPPPPHSTFPRPPPAFPTRATDHVQKKTRLFQVPLFYLSLSVCASQGGKIYIYIILPLWALTWRKGALVWWRWVT